MLLSAEDAARRGADLIEWRADGLRDLGACGDLVRQAVEQCSLPSIVTCRPRSEGGEFNGSEAERAHFFTSLLRADQPPRYLDVEWMSLRQNDQLRRALIESMQRQPEGQRTGLIVSSHDFSGRPADLLQRVEAMTRDDLAAVVKLAWRARSLRDNLEAFELLRERRKPMIAVCLGEFGLLSRVLAPKFAGLLTFASGAQGLESAPGQPLLDDLRSLYRFSSINADTRVYGVIGWPVAHSRSPQLHNAAFAAVGFDGIYLPLPIPPEYEHFKATVGSLIDHAWLSFSGASVTIPHKQNLVRFLRERGGRLDQTAEAVGAANTLLVEPDGSIAGCNTDAPAAVEALLTAMRSGPEGVAGRRAAVIGAGGVAAAVAWGLAGAGCDVVIFNRSRERAGRLAQRIRSAAPGGAVEVRTGRDEDLCSERFDFYINATPVGMEGGPDPAGSPLPADVALDDSAMVLDTVYTPRRTPLIREAEARGSRVVGGLEMFIRQAAMQFELWTGHSAPSDVFSERGMSDEGG